MTVGIADWDAWLLLLGPHVQISITFQLWEIRNHGTVRLMRPLELGPKVVLISGADCFECWPYYWDVCSCLTVGFSAFQNLKSSGIHSMSCVILVALSHGHYFYIVFTHRCGWAWAREEIWSICAPTIPPVTLQPRPSSCNATEVMQPILWRFVITLLKIYAGKVCPATMTSIIFILVSVWGNLRKIWPTENF